MGGLAGHQAAHCQAHCPKSIVFSDHLLLGYGLNLPQTTFPVILYRDGGRPRIVEIGFIAKGAFAVGAMAGREHFDLSWRAKWYAIKIPIEDIPHDPAQVFGRKCTIIPSCLICAFGTR